MGVPAIADEICARYLAAVDDRHPDLLVGLYVVGSIALDDFRPGASDIDVVCVTRRPVTVADIAPVHAELGTASSRPFFDGVYVTADELAAPPATGAKGVAVIEGKPIGESRAERHAVTWLTLARHGIGRRDMASAGADRHHRRHGSMSTSQITGQLDSNTYEQAVAYGIAPISSDRA